MGRFITPDPIGLAGEDVDVYGYCLDDPINFHDRTGLFHPSHTYKNITSTFEPHSFI
ncbi:RHS repeat-associated core domain-containing protein [Maridesulfovibrio ferrireducens]|uniref:RHS repeat-associated core domain-containing protein n=1 Tax=Maridesulfovibrio ferrireducens TaxID=246191 RepID=UPI000B8820A0|nr:RHS repeat-associated core domain-containing protein [Maridesulfovibrio ferrireducens]